MATLADDDSRWDERIARARVLAPRYPAATDVLTFYAALAEYQKSLLRTPNPDSRIPSPDFHTPETNVRLTVPLLESLDLEPVLAAIPDFLSWIQRTAPTRLVKAADEMRRLDRAEWRHLAESYFLNERHNREPVDQTRIFVLEALLQPMAERWAIFRRPNPKPGIASPEPRFANPEPRVPNPESRIPSLCPFCRRPPVVGVLREEGHGAKRTILCGLCLSERDYLRVICPSCGEQQFDVLPVFTADRFAHIRIDACERCRTYLKTIDLTKDGLAVPLVDDIASVPMDLWAREQGYVRLSPNLLGL